MEEFWMENPNALWGWKWIPLPHDTPEEQMNAVTRLIIVSSIVMFLWLGTFRVFLVGFVTLLVIVLLYSHQLKMMESMTFRKELVDRARKAASLSAIHEPFDDLFDKPTPENPFCNPTLADIHATVPKKPAPPPSDPQTKHDILSSAMQMVQDQHPDCPDIAQKLFGTSHDMLQWEQSLRSFYTVPSSTIPNDQAAFASFCYGSMASCKEGNAIACAKFLPRHSL
jgi:hypothetical protein